MLSIIHFCLGADLKKLEIPVDELNDWTFNIELDLYGERITASRAINNPNVVRVSNNTQRSSNKKKGAEESIDGVYKNDDWKKLLGKSIFKIDKKDYTNTKYSPSFRSLICYFIRLGYDAYSSPFRHFRTQKTYDWQINNAFLLGLNWIHASELQEIRDKENAANTLASAIKTGVSLNQGELEAERVRLEKEVMLEKNALSNFKVHPQYKELVQSTNLLTNTIHELSNKNIILYAKLQRYTDSVASERIPPNSTIEKLYKEAGMCFPNAIKNTLEEAKVFHETIIKNRKDFLSAEIVQIKNQISDIETEIKSATEKRAEIMFILESHGALEEFMYLQERLLSKKVQLEDLKLKISDIKKISAIKKEIKAKKIEIETKLQRDHELSRSHWEKAVELFNENSLALYKEPGDLIINTTEKGYQFSVEIQRSNSEGVGKMKIFCYDLMLVETLSKQESIDFLIHDSTLFDGVDSRQRALALEYANEKAINEKFQYICFLNSDMIPYEDFSSDFDINKFIRLRLTDQPPSESLLGFKFEIKKNKMAKR